VQQAGADRRARFPVRPFRWQPHKRIRSTRSSGPVHPWRCLHPHSPSHGETEGRHNGCDTASCSPARSECDRQASCAPWSQFPWRRASTRPRSHSERQTDAD